MKRFAVCCLLAVATWAVIAADGESARIRPSGGRLGGMLVRPGTRRGKIIVGNAQTKVSVATIQQAVSDFRRIFDPEIEIKSVQKPTVADAGMAVDAIGGQVALFIVEDKRLPSLLCAPESGWTMVNVTALAEGAEETLLAKRVRIEVVRGLAFVSGAHGSAYADTLMDAVRVPLDLDKMDADATLPVDVASRFLGYLKAWGITQGLKVHYRQAVREGWAPAPTNAVQRTVWDEVMAKQAQLPSKPMRITPDMKPSGNR